MDPQTQVDLSKLSDADKKELNQFLTQEAQKTNIQQSMFPGPPGLRLKATPPAVSMCTDY